MSSIWVMILLVDSRLRPFFTSTLIEIRPFSIAGINSMSIWEYMPKAATNSTMAVTTTRARLSSNLRISWP